MSEKSVRTSGWNARQYVQSLTPFHNSGSNHRHPKGSTLWGEYVGGLYVVYSYGKHWPLLANWKGVWFKNTEKSSRTTNRHRGYVNPGPAVPMDCAGMKFLIDYGPYPERKAQLIEKYRDINVEHLDWWDCVYSDFDEEMRAKGIYVYEKQFRGFWSQGDGASFTGYVSDNALFLKAHELTETCPWVTKLLEMGGDFTLKIERTSRHYVHENTVGVDLTFTDMFADVLPRDDLRSAIADCWDKLLDAEYETLAGTAQTIIRDHCRDLYRRLEKEYNYLTSDEAVWEAIERNELFYLDEYEKENV